MASRDMELLAQAALSAARLPNVESVVALARQGVEVLAEQARQKALGESEIADAFRRYGAQTCPAY